MTTNHEAQTTKTTKQAVFRYKLTAGLGQSVVMMPANFRVTGANVGKKGVEIYALVNPADEATEPVAFHVAKTGEELDTTAAEFVATLVAMPGAPALHIFRML